MKKIVSIILALVMCFFAVAALASCGESAYEIAVKNGFKGTEQQWLDSLKGDKGQDGENAAAPTIEISKDGYWVINGVKTDVKAAGTNGDNGSEGVDGREVEFRKNATHLQWRYKGESDSAWKDLISIKELQGVAGSNGTNGTDGEDGKDGREVVFRTGETHIQWKYKNEADTEWKDLVAISTLKGADGKDSRDVQFRVGETHLQWKYANEPDTDWKDLLAVTELKGADGREVEFNVDAEKGLLQWRYKGDEAWIDLSELSVFNGADGKSAYEIAVANGFVGTEAEWLESLKGANGDKGDKGDKGEDGEDGEDGADGKDGREIEVFVQGNEIRWRYVGDVGSYPLVALEDITIGISDIKYTRSEGRGGLVDIYTIYYTDGSKMEYSVTNGNGVDRIEFMGTEKGLDEVEIDHYRIWYTNGDYFDYTVTNGRQGVDGKPAREVEFRMNGPQLQWRYTTDENGNAYAENEGWVNLYNFGVQLEKTDFVLWLDENGDVIGEIPTLNIVKDNGQHVPATNIQGNYNLEAAGEYTIVVTDGGKSSEYTITVTTIQLAQTDFSIWNGSEAELALNIMNPDLSVDTVLVTSDMISGKFNPGKAGTYDISVEYLGATNAATITITTHALANEEFEFWTHWEEAPGLEVIRTNPDGSSEVLSGASMSVAGEYNLKVAGTYSVTVTYAGVSGEYNTEIKVATYAVNKTQFWYTAKASDLIFTITTPDGQESSEQYMGDAIEWGTPGIYTIVVNGETLNIELQNMIYFEDFNGVTATDKAGILEQLGWKDNVNYFENGQPTDKSHGKNGKDTFASYWSDTGISTNSSLLAIDNGRLKIDNYTDNSKYLTANFKLTEDGYMHKNLLGDGASYTIQYDVTFIEGENYAWVSALPDYYVSETGPFVEGYSARISHAGYAQILVQQYINSNYRWIQAYKAPYNVINNKSGQDFTWGGYGNRRILTEIFGQTDKASGMLWDKTITVKVEYIYREADTVSTSGQPYYDMIMYIKKPGDTSFTKHLETDYSGRGYLGRLNTENENNPFTGALAFTIGGYYGNNTGPGGFLKTETMGTKYIQSQNDGGKVATGAYRAATSFYLDNFAVWAGTGDMPTCTNTNIYEGAE